MRNTEVAELLERLSILPVRSLFSLEIVSQSEKSKCVGIRHTCACILAISVIMLI